MHDPWSALYELSGQAWNHIEGQWAAAKIDIDAHNHDTRYYTKTSADATFFALITSVALAFDADKVDGSHLTDLVSAALPIGAIMIWSGTDGTVPSGWHIADGGTYGGIASSDLRDRFVIGAGDLYAVNATVGPASWNGTITPTGSVAVGNHTLSTAELPAHTHTFTEYCPNQAAFQNLSGTGLYLSIANTTAAISAQASGDGAHGHTGSSASFTAVDPRPTYYSLYYIMKYA
jgi:hypothetical protein